MQQFSPQPQPAPQKSGSKGLILIVVALLVIGGGLILVVALGVFGVGIYLAIDRQAWAMLAAGCACVPGASVRVADPTGGGGVAGLSAGGARPMRRA